MRINENFAALGGSYLFGKIAARVKQFEAENPRADIVSLGIGDVTRPLTPSVICAMHAAVTEMSCEETFRGYGPENGYEFLRLRIAEYYRQKGVTVSPSQIFVGDGAKSDLGNILDLFDRSRVLMPDPVYPAYYDVNVMKGNKVCFADGNKANSFRPLPPTDGEYDIIYICSPNNPTGAVYTAEELKLWVDYARATGAVIFFDAAYECYVRDKSLPTTIFSVEGARECAIEFCSLSKTAGFTGVRCGYTVVPEELAGGRLAAMWDRRQSTKFNGVSYVVQRAAEAVFTPQGLYETAKNNEYYLANAQLMHRMLADAGVWHTGGQNSPYIWLQCPAGMTSWEYFDLLLVKAGVVGTPGVGFGRNGEGYFRLTAFGNSEKTERAMTRLCEVTKACR